MERTFYVAGVQFRPRGDIDEVGSLIKDGDYLELVPEPTNKYDSNAIRIEYNVEEVDDVRGIHIGYVPRTYSAEVAGLLEYGIKVECIVEKFFPSAKPWEMFKVVIKEVDE